MKVQFVRNRHSTKESGKLETAQCLTGSASLIGATLTGAFILLLLFMAFPASNTNSIAKASEQRNILDGAIKQIFSGNKPQSATQDSRSQHQESDKRHLELDQFASLSALPIDDFSKTSVNNGTTASFPFVYPVMGPRKSSGYGYRLRSLGVELFRQFHNTCALGRLSCV